MIKKLMILMLMVIPLVGCIAIPIAIVSATAGGAIIYDKRSFKTMSEDQNARAYAQRWLNNDPTIKGHGYISVAVFNHTALLVGQAQTPEVRARAYQIVSRVKNIQRVYNQITIGPRNSKSQRAKDSLITAEVRTAMLAKPGLRSTNLKVVTENNIVYLMGEVPPKQEALATDVARRVSGVQQVVKVFNQP